MRLSLLLAVQFTATATFNDPVANGPITWGGMFTPSPEVIDYGDLEIDWTIQRRYKARTWDIPYGMTKNKLYVTGDATEDPQFETVLDVGCRGARGMSPDGGPTPWSPEPGVAVVGGIWDEFKNRDVRRVGDDEVLKYWGPISSQDYDDEARHQENFTVAGLLKYADGRCEAWAKFMVQAVAIHGITIVAKGVRAREALRPAEVPPGGVAMGTGIQIKPGLPAQGGGPPAQSLFSNHAVVQLSDSGVEDTIYDPSYGLKHDNLKAWETASVKAYAYWYDTDGIEGEDFAVPLWEEPHPSQPDQTDVQNTEFYAI